MEKLDIELIRDNLSILIRMIENKEGRDYLTNHHLANILQELKRYEIDCEEIVMKNEISIRNDKLSDKIYGSYISITPKVRVSDKTEGRSPFTVEQLINSTAICFNTDLLNELSKIFLGKFFKDKEKGGLFQIIDVIKEPGFIFATNGGEIIRRKLSEIKLLSLEKK